MQEGSMTDQRPPQDSSKPEDAEDIIDLTDVVAASGTDDDDIIDLTEIVEENADQEVVIELTDVVDVPADEMPAAEETPVEEPVIDLTDPVVVEEVEAEAEPVSEEDMADLSLLEDEEDAPIAAKAEAEESTSGELEFAEMELDIEERSDDQLFDSLGMNLEADLLPSEEDAGELDFNLSTQELSDAIDLLDAKLAEEPPKPPAAAEGELRAPTTLQSEELEAALENVIRKMFAEKIDHLLNDAIEKTVSTEIARLKEQLLGDAPEEP
jgi:hypothetical protein